MKFGDLYQYEEEYNIKFSNGSTSSTEVSSSNMRNKLAGRPKIASDPMFVILSYCYCQKFQRIERGPKAGGVAYPELNIQPNEDKLQRNNLPIKLCLIIEELSG